jgi:hypothetical protein
MMAKAAAAASVPATTKVGKGVITIPPTANVEAIRRSPTDEAEPSARARGQQPPTFTIAEHDDHKGQRPQRPDIEPIRQTPKARTAIQKTNLRLP